MWKFRAISPSNFKYRLKRYFPQSKKFFLLEWFAANLVVARGSANQCLFLIGWNLSKYVAAATLKIVLAPESYEVRRQKQNQRRRRRKTRGGKAWGQRGPPAEHF